jgi:microcystin-dependent protein
LSEPFIAEVKIFAGNFAPRGYAFCDGQLLPIAQNTALFALIGTTYGGDGRTTLGLPNLQGRAALHPGNGPGLTSRRWGETGGAPTATITQAQLGSHTHSLIGSGVDGPEVSPAGNTLAQNAGGAPQYNASPDTDMATGAVASTGGAGAPHDNMHPYLVLNFIIALTGLFPSRS